MNGTVGALILLLNGTVVSIFGALLSASFCDCTRSRKNWPVFGCGTALILATQGLIYMFWGVEHQVRLYPLIFHLPLVLLLICLTRRVLLSVTAILSAYLFCQIRRWLALLVMLVLPGGEAVQGLAELAITLPLLSFLLYSSAWNRKQQELHQIQSDLDLELSQAVQEINALRESQALAVQYRHDLRHHLQYVSSCIANGQEERAQQYISSVCGEIEAQRVRRWCENEAANLILSSFAGRAEKAGVKMNVHEALPVSFPVPDGDLCVLLSNSLENALEAYKPLAQAGPPV